MSSSLLDGLNPEQRAAAEAVFEPVLVMAPMGTGKTRTLVARAAHAIAQGVAPEHILCVSFTNRAARETRERLQSDLGPLAQHIQSRTFHGLCAILCRAEAETLGLDHDFLIWDDDDTRETLLRLAARRRLTIDSADHDRFSATLSGTIQDAKLGLIHTDLDEHFRVKLDQVNLKATSRAQDFALPQLLEDYDRELRENHAVDFADLIARTRQLFAEDGPALDRWRDRLRWIQVDEVQDTNLPEYAILASLARPTRHLAFFGDIDQTIYEWRHSNPRKILEIFRAEFAPVKEIHFTRNYRSTETILNACRAILHACPGAVAGALECHSPTPGDPLEFHPAASPDHEARWIAARARQIHGLDAGSSWRDIAILTRSNQAAAPISKALAEANIPHYLAEQFRFFHRAEIRDALAYLRLLGNPFDANSLRRVLQRPPKGIGAATIDKIVHLPRTLCLRLTDFILPSIALYGDPYQPLLDAWAENRVAVLDTETTGTDPAVDELVEVAAIRTGAAGEQARFRRHITPSRPVGLSQSIHGYSDAFLAAHGIPPAEARDLTCAFLEGTIPVGHNLLFDLRFLGPPRPALWYDTLELTRRFQRLPSYRLADICRAKGITLVPNHQALDDVLATAELLARLMVPLREHALARREALAALAPPFAPLADQLASWRAAAAYLRPHELLGAILEESGLSAWWAKQDDGPHRTANFLELCELFERYDDDSLSPARSLEEILEIAALGNDTDRFLRHDDRVLLLTVHQAKGLEFPTVFVAATTDNEFPSWLAQKENRLTEEHRLFYVAASRARRRLLFSWHARNTRGRDQLPSRFLADLPGFPG